MERDRKTEQLTEWDREILGVPEKDRKREKEMVLIQTGPLHKQRGCFKLRVKGVKKVKNTLWLNHKTECD